MISRHDNEEDIISIFYLEYRLLGGKSHTPTIICSISIILIITIIIIINVDILTILYLISPIEGSAQEGY